VRREKIGRAGKFRGNMESPRTREVVKTGRQTFRFSLHLNPEKKSPAKSFWGEKKRYLKKN